MSGVEYPNKTYVADFSQENEFGVTKHTIILTAKNEDVASDYLYHLFKIRPKLTWLMNCNHTTIYDQRGNKPLEIQAKILFKTFNHMHKK